MKLRNKILAMAVVAVAGFNTYLANDIRVQRNELSLLNLENIADAVTQAEAIASGEIVFGQDGEASDWSWANFFTGNGWHKDEWGERIPCQNGSNWSVNLSGSHNGSSVSGTFTNTGGPTYKWECHTDGYENCSGTSC